MEPSHRTLLTTYLGPQRRRVVWLALLLGALVAMPLIGPQIIRAFIDRATGADPDMRALFVLAGVFMAQSVALQVVGVGTGYLSGLVGWTATNALRADLTRHALGLDMPFHNQRTPGEMIERVDGDVTAMSNFLSQFVTQVLWSVLLLIGMLFLIAREDLRVGAGVALFAAATGFAMYRLRSLAVPAWTAQRAASAQQFGFIEERLAGLDDIRSLGGGPWVMRGFTKVARDVYVSGMRGERRGMMFWSSTRAMFALGSAFTLLSAVVLFGRGEITVGTVWLLVQYTHMLREPLELLGDQLRDFQKAAAGASRVGELLRERPSITDGEGAIPDGPLSVSLDHVTFSYGRGGLGGQSERSERAPRIEGPVLHDVSLDLAPGRVLGLLGRTGSGKTTMARLLLRLWDTEHGAVRLGGVDVRDATLASMRSRVGYVTQDVQLFRASVRDNLTLFADGYDDVVLAAVLDELGLGEWFRSLPDGMDTKLEGGLSAGESQLLAFARVFLHDPGLVILDEASARLDPATERRIETAVDRLLAGRTAVLIAHRLATVERADEICVLDGGRIAEHGERSALAADPASRFAQLLRTGLDEVLV